MSDFDKETETSGKLEQFKAYTNPDEGIEGLATRLAEYGEMLFVGLGEAEDSLVAAFDEICEFALTAAILAENEGCADRIKALLKGQPKPYNWAKQNYNAGWDQAIHHAVTAICAKVKP